MPTVERFIEVRDNAAVLVEKKILKAVSNESLRRALTSSDVQTPILPPAIFFSRTGARSTIVIVRDKIRKPVQFLNEDPVTIFLPTRVYFVHMIENSIRKTHQFFCKLHPSKFNAVMLQAPLPNRYEDGTVCEMGIHLMASTLPLAERIDHVIEQIEATRYNNDLANIGLSLAPPEFLQEMGPELGFKQMLLAWGRLSDRLTDEEMLDLRWQEAHPFEAYCSYGTR